MIRITDADGTWDCGGNFSTNVSDMVLNGSDAKEPGTIYAGCIFNPSGDELNNFVGLNGIVRPNLLIKDAEREFDFYVNIDIEHYYPIIPITR